MIMKSVAEIIFAVTLLVGVVKFSNEALPAFRKESLEKVHKGIPSLETFTRTLTKK